MTTKKKAAKKTKNKRFLVVCFEKWLESLDGIPWYSTSEAIVIDQPSAEAALQFFRDLAKEGGNLIEDEIMIAIPIDHVFRYATNPSFKRISVKSKELVGS